MNHDSNAWLWAWSPSVHFPWSGAVQQAIAPTTTWLADLIPPQAGNGRVEQRMFNEVGSYGRQLGWLSEVLLKLVEQNDGLTLDDSARTALDKIRTARAKLEAFKAEEGEAVPDALRAWLNSLHRTEAEHPEKLQKALRQIQTILDSYGKQRP